MINKPIYRRLLESIGKAEGEIAASLLLKELAEVFDEFGDEIRDLFADDPEEDAISMGYYYGADWLRSWAEEIDNV